MTKFTEKDIQELDKVQDMTGRWALGAIRCTGLEAVRSDMGWSTFRERITKGKSSAVFFSFEWVPVVSLGGDLASGVVTCLLGW